MTTEYIIIDASVKYMNARNVIEEGLLYTVETKWCRKLNLATKFADTDSAIKVARELNQELPVKVLMLQTEGNKIGVGEVKF
jgi:hypothetical protein